MQQKKQLIQQYVSANSAKKCNLFSNTTQLIQQYSSASGHLNVQLVFEEHVINFSPGLQTIKIGCPGDDDSAIFKGPI